jgi:hypothetical protein
VSLNFEPNVGQAQNGAQFLAHGTAYAVSLSAQGGRHAAAGNVFPFVAARSLRGSFFLKHRSLPEVQVRSPALGVNYWFE